MKINRTGQMNRKPYVNSSGVKNDEKFLLKIQDEYIPGFKDHDVTEMYLNLLKDVEKNAPSSDRYRYNLSLNTEVFTDAITGGVLGMGLLSNSFFGPIGGILVGAAAGAYFGWDKVSSRDSGKVEVDLEGQKFSQKFYINPYHYNKSPELEKALEKLQERVLPAGKNMTDGLPEPSREKLEELKPFADKLVDLGKNRRLAASSGEKTKAGKEALHLIDANMAKNLIASGKPVFIINGSEITETPHKFTATARNTDRSLLVTETHDMLEKRIDYTISEIKTPGDLTKVSDGKGVPEGLLGVYKDESSYKEIVYKKSQSGYGEINGPSGKGVRKDEYSMAEKSAVNNNGIKTTGSDEVKTRTVHYWNMPAYAAMGTALAAYCASSALGLPPTAGPALMITGGFISYQLGKRIMRNENMAKKFEIGK